MPRRSEIKGIANSFLESFISRNSDYDGYWLFGLLGIQKEPISINLIIPDFGETNSIINVTRKIAFVTFQHLMNSSGFPFSNVSEAILLITQRDSISYQKVNGLWRGGHTVLLEICIQTDLGRLLKQHKTIFVAPHDPAVELRSTRRLIPYEY